MCLTTHFSYYAQEKKTLLSLRSVMQSKNEIGIDLLEEIVIKIAF